MTTAQGLYGGRKVREGTVVSDKMQKTVLVAVQQQFRHRLYKKTVRRIRRFMAHDEKEDAQFGDRVRIVESRAISRHKRWRVVEVLSRAELPELAAESIDLDLLGEVKPEEDVEKEAASGLAVSEAGPSEVPEEAEAEERVVEPEEAVTEAEAPGEASDAGATIEADVAAQEEEIEVESADEAVSAVEEAPDDESAEEEPK